MLLYLDFITTKLPSAFWHKSHYAVPGFNKTKKQASLKHEMCKISKAEQIYFERIHEWLQNIK